MIANTMITIPYIMCDYRKITRFFMGYHERIIKFFNNNTIFLQLFLSTRCYFMLMLNNEDHYERRQIHHQ